MNVLEEFSLDFGRNIKQIPKQIITPTNIKDLQAAFVETANAKIAIRGKAHSTGGQVLVNNGIVIDMKSFNAIGPITKTEDGDLSIELQGGALWKDAFNYCLAQGFMPPTYADWLDLTVGGTLSTGGVGQCSFKKGLQIDNVLTLEVVTIDGKIITCSVNENKELFDFVCGGYGQFGIISRAWVRLEQAPASVFVCKILFTDLKSFLKAQTLMTDSNDIDAIQSHIVLADYEELRSHYKNLPKQAQFFILEVTKYINQKDNLNDFKEYIAEITNSKLANMFAQETSFEYHVNRAPPLLANPLEKNFPKHHHCCFFISAKEAYLVLEKFFSTKEHCEAMGKGTILVVPLKHSKIKAKYFMLPDSENLFFIGILRRHLSSCDFSTLVNINETSYQLALNHGATIYPVGSGSFLNEPSYWQQHYDKLYLEIVKGKKKYDPDNRLTPNISIFF